MRALLLAFPLVFANFSLTGCASKDPTPHTYQIGESVPLGHLVYTVFERQWLPQTGAGFAAHIPQYRFYAIRIAAANNGSAVVILPSVFLVDDRALLFPKLNTATALRTLSVLNAPSFRPKPSAAIWSSTFRRSITNSG